MSTCPHGARLPGVRPDIGSGSHCWGREGDKGVEGKDVVKHDIAREGDLEVAIRHTRRGDLEAEGYYDFRVGEVDCSKVGIVIKGIDVPLRREGSHVV